MGPGILIESVDLFARIQCLSHGKVVKTLKNLKLCDWGHAKKTLYRDSSTTATQKTPEAPALSHAENDVVN